MGKHWLRDLTILTAGVLALFWQLVFSVAVRSIGGRQDT